MPDAMVVTRIRDAVRNAIPTNQRALIAVSGGMDSMVLLHAATAVLRPEQMVAATFDHASGSHSAAAVDFVQAAAMSAGIPVVVGRGEPIARPSEAAWRDARISFLRAAAAEHRAVICTAHTRDDQVETVLFRELRGAGPRGLAGLAAAGDVRRPLLSFTRADIADYARLAGVEWVDDPTNLDLGFTRNRLRHDVLPVLRAAVPEIETALADVGDRAAAWRADLEAFVDRRIEFAVDAEDDVLEVRRDSIARYDDDALGILWPALLARIGLAADRRGTRRLVAFTKEGTTGQRIQLSGGWTVYRRRKGFEVRHDGVGRR